MNYSAVVFGGRRGNIFTPPSQVANASADMGFDFVPPFTGNLRIEATISANGRIGASAGSGTAIPDFQDVLLSFLLPLQLEAFLDIARALVLESAAVVRTDAYLSVNSRQEVTVTVGGHGFGGTFPVPPWSQSGEFNPEQTTVSLTVPVTQGQPILIVAGMRARADARGWSEAHWNIVQSRESFVTSVVLTQVP